jgi:hypothetical protein
MISPGRSAFSSPSSALGSTLPTAPDHYHDVLPIVVLLLFQSLPASHPARSESSPKLDSFPDIPVRTLPRHRERGPPSLLSGSTPRRISWEALLREHFDRKRCLPRPSAEELSASDQTDLEEDVRALARKPGLGELLLSLRERAAPEVGSVASERMTSEGVASKRVDSKWIEGMKPGRCVYGRDWTVRPDQGRGDPWDRLEGRGLVVRAMTAVVADVDAIQRARRDYARQLQDQGDDLLDLYPIAGSYVCGEDPHGRPFASITEYMLNDLPWPYANAPCELHVLELAGDEGDLVTETYSTSPDFYWLAGRDAYFPVRTAAGAHAGYLLVTSFGMDVRGVPDSRGDVADRVKSHLAWIQRNAERLARR